MAWYWGLMWVRMVGRANVIAKQILCLNCLSTRSLHLDAAIWRVSLRCESFSPTSITWESPWLLFLCSLSFFFRFLFLLVLDHYHNSCNFWNRNYLVFLSSFNSVSPNAWKMQFGPKKLRWYKTGSKKRPKVIESSWLYRWKAS